MSSLTDKGRRGVVLVLALGFILVMTWLTLAILQQVREELALKTAPKSLADPRETAYQLLEVSMGVLAEIQRFEDGLYTPSQGWGFPLSYAGMTDTEILRTALPGTLQPELDATEGDENAHETGEDIDLGDSEQASGAEDLLAGLEEDLGNAGLAPDGYSHVVTRIEPSEDEGSLSPDTIALALPLGIEARVRLYDESGKLSLTTTTAERWQLFFEEMAFEVSEAKRLTASLLDWMDPDDEEREDGAETETYSQLEPPYRAANRPLRDFQELRYVDGFKTLFFDEEGRPNEQYVTFRRNVSLYHQGEPNYNTASELLLRVLAEEQEFQEDSILDFLAGNDMVFGTEDDRVLRPGLDENELPRDENGNPISIPNPVQFIIADIAVSTGQSIFYLKALLDVSQPHPGGGYPFRILRVTENQPLS